MAQLVVRKIDDDVKERLRQRAARHGHSMEEEIRIILRDAVRDDAPLDDQPGLGTQIASLFRGIGLTTEIPELRGQPDRPATFDE